MKTESKRGMGRREFIVLTSTTALAAAAFGQELLTQKSSSVGAVREYSLGYVEPKASLGGTPGRGLTPNVMSVDGVTSGDGAFINQGAKVSIRGYNVLPKSPTGRLSMQLVVQFRENGSSRVDPFTAWSYTRKTGGASPVSFLVPVDQDQRLHLLFSSDSEVSLARKQAAQPGAPITRRDLLSDASAAADLESGADPGAITLTLLSEKGTPKLQRGYYLISPVGDGVSEPDWSRYELRKTDNGLKLFALDGFDAGPADLEYLVLYIDYFELTKGSRPDRAKKTE